MVAKVVKTPLKRLLKDIENTRGFVKIILAATKTGWLTDGRMMFLMTAEEKLEILKIMVNGEDSLDVLSILPSVVGPRMKVVREIPKEQQDGYCERPSLIELATMSGQKKYFVEAWRFKILEARSPKATIHLNTFEEPTKEVPHTIVFSDKKVVSICMPFLLLEKYAPLREE
jgi:hypothetical protein